MPPFDFSILYGVEGKGVEFQLVHWEVNITLGMNCIQEHVKENR